jgi:hypothetical protein
MKCNISQGPVVINNTHLICNNKAPTSIQSPVTINGTTSQNWIRIENTNATIILESVTIKSEQPFVCHSCSVSILLTGINSLNATSSDRSGLECASLGNVTIDSNSGGSLFTRGGPFGPGIGPRTSEVCESVTILNSNITSIGGQYCPGIGSGYGTSSSSSVLNRLLILHSNISARGGENGAGIGNGRAYLGDSVISSLLIFNSTVNASSGYLGAGIGNGYAYDGESKIENLMIVESVIESYGSEAAAIGSGHGSNGIAWVGDLLINKSFIVAVGATGIGSGFANGGGTAVVNNLQILESNVHSNGLAGLGAGIGSGYCETYENKGGSSRVDSIQIVNSTIDAKGDLNCAGIGTGFANDGNSSVGNITIDQSFVKATGGLSGSGIGEGKATIKGSVFIDSVIIINSMIDIHMTKSSIGIGGDNLRELVFVGDISLNCSSNSSSCINAHSTTMLNVSIQAQVPTVLFSNSPNGIGLNELIIFYSNKKEAQVEPNLDIFGKMIQLVELNLSSSGLWRLRDMIQFNSSEIESFVVSIPNVSSHKISISSEFDRGFICPNSTMSEFSVPSMWNLFKIGYFVQLSPSSIFEMTHFNPTAALDSLSFSTSLMFDCSLGISQSSFLANSQLTFLSTADLPLIESTANLPLIESTANVPLIESTANVPLIESTADLPLIESTANFPLIESTANVPLIESTANIPLTKSTMIQTAESISDDVAEWKIYVIVGVVVGVVIVVLIVILIIVCKPKSRVSDDDIPSASADLDFVSHVHSEETLEVTFHESFTYEGSAIDTSSSTSGFISVMNQSLLKD